MSLHPSTRQLIKLTSHPEQFDVDPEPLQWGAADPKERGPIVATVSDVGRRNAIGTHNGPYAIYRAVGVARQQIDARMAVDLESTEPVVKIGPFPAWCAAQRTSIR